ncbi:unnamed protein product [Adineta ricciae]|uniref:Gamma-glutamyltransferase n=1 Tax=Adineta ricciae TaxID=249248 RepID=A0A815ISI2_ADIRI|nr:unnamed protein product [Adineta ricciae]CAF1369543.1 unnamed protein product [Adineta ricciae]
MQNVTHESYSIEKSSPLGKYQRAAIAVDNEICSKIGREILEKNGTTVDAALAAAICNGVMNQHSMGIGGGCVMVISSKKKGKVFSIIGREKAPLASNENLFIGKENLSSIGGLSIAVPGELRAYRKAYEEFGGGVSWKDLFQPTIQLCRQGFPISSALAQAIQQNKQLILNDPNMKELFVKDKNTNELYQFGDSIKQLKLAKTLQIIAEQGDDVFYHGELSQKILQEIQDEGGIITKEDLETYDIDYREAHCIEFDDRIRAFTTHAPTSGPILTFILNVLQGFQFSANQLEESTSAALFYHRLIETLKFAYAKRSELSDPQFNDITQLISDLTSKEHAEEIRKRIDDDKTFDCEYYGGIWFDKSRTGTAHLSLAGPDGDAIALTSTINHYFGSKVLGKHTGIFYNNQMDSFSTRNTSNQFGIPSSPANYIFPGKRPVSSMSPIILWDKIKEHWIQILGGSGGPRITTSVAQVSLINWLFKQNIKTTIDSSRIHSQLLPNEIIVEQGFDEKIINELRKRGHQIVSVDSIGSAVQGIEWKEELNEFWANCDRRKGGKPDGF